MLPDPPVSDIAHVIQLSVAPVFLLTAAGTFLAVLTARLGRIVDRARVLSERMASLPEAGRAEPRAELRSLERRRRMVQLALTCGTATALLVCVVIATAFVGYVAGWRVSAAIAVLFVAAMGFFAAALLLFLREVLQALLAVQPEEERPH